MQTENLVFCEECILNKKTAKREIVTKCHTCTNLIYKDERIQESSRNLYKEENFLVFVEHFLGFKKVEKIIQCDECYKEWGKERIKVERWWKLKKWLLNILLCLLTIFLLHFFYPEMMKKYLETSEEKVITFFIFFFTIIFILESAPKSSRYKIRKRKK